MTGSSPRFLYAGGHCSHGAANSDWAIIPTQLCLFYCCSVPNNQLLSPTMPLIKALQRCDNHLSLVINPGFYCPVISQTSVWYFACSPLLIFPQQPGSSRTVLNSCCELLPLLPPPRSNRERSQPMWKAWVPSLCNICGLRWRVPFVMTPFPNQKDEGVNNKAYGSFEFTSLLTTIHVDFLSQMSIRKYFQWANVFSRFKWTISPREIYSSFCLGIYVHFIDFSLCLLR